MYKLSPEIVSHICSYLESHDVCQFRLVCKNYSEIGGQYICPEIFLKMTHDDLRRLFELSRQPRLALGLRSLHYAPADLLRPDNYMKIPTMYHEKLYPEVYTCHWAEGSSKHQQEQNDIMQTHYDFMCFSNTFAKFPRLRHITLYFGKERERARTGKAHHAGNHHLKLLLDVITETRIKLSSLTLHNVHWRSADGKDGVKLQTAFGLVTSLERLELTINNAYADSSELDPVKEYLSFQNYMHKGVLQKSLPLLTNVRVLKISFSQASPPGDTRTMLLDQIIPLNHIWTHLTSLELSHITCERQELTKFLMRHKSTLRELSLWDVSLKNTSWVPLLAGIRKELYLTVPCVYGLLMGRSEDDDKRFHFWNLGLGTGDMYRLVNGYIERGGETYPNMTACPLTEENATYG
ncbi:hypothetical protein F4781DRAFT_126555 [Annulohypoxylon bovei var. microspora]|nr:hypothetical protein F4781DRAFT_126555 [Annulohypoxylon bovei var. microspora]